MYSPSSEVADAYAAGLRTDGISYFFTGEHELDLRSALEFLSRELGVKGWLRYRLRNA